MSGNSFYPSPCTHFPFPVFVCLTSIWVFYIHTHTLFYCTLSKFTITNIYRFFFSSSSLCVEKSFFFLLFYCIEKGENGEYVAFKCIIAVLFSKMCNTRTSNRLYFSYICDTFFKRKSFNTFFVP